jgi:hypothetical protein
VAAALNLAVQDQLFYGGRPDAVFFVSRSVSVLVLMFVTAFYEQSYLFAAIVLFCFLAMSENSETFLERAICFC